ncbi:Lrp/AsnC ligand binding domain-containing protein [Halobellus ruber]|uniref:Lrp/AsnC ligand binding domain-containing protein n=1 Tax=Halobellus ruber TaxID=2761102 RepID=A0A7J9SDF4_9EURY|nr:Lrp/AsnC ligand binding domain-containing protein [Halobellus ruber]MBB6644954.1 Lrp/AsnC ligand binding domain-containing protein [Halobellus ruber]
MVHAFVMIKTGPGESEGLLEAIRGLENVVEAHVVAGGYDIIAEADAPEVYEVLSTASTGIQGLESVIDTRTYIAMDE